MESVALFLQSVFVSLWGLLVETGWWLLAGFAAAGLVHAFVPAEAIKQRLGGHGFASSVKAAAAGVVLPLCSCAVIPVAAQLRASGASKGATASFAISTPQTGEESIPLTWALLGPVFALVRPIAALCTAVLAGTLIDAFPARTKRSTDQSPGSCGAPNSSCGCSSEATVSLNVLTTNNTEAPPEPAAASCCGGMPAPPKATLASKLALAARYGFVTLPTTLALWLVAGLVLSAVIDAAIPTGKLADLVGTGLLPMLLMLVIGIPLYICATGSTPLAYTLVVAGLSPGAALVLLLAGPATNAATIAWAIKDLGVRGTAIYLGSVAVVAVAFGVALDALAPALAPGLGIAEAALTHNHAESPWAFAGAVTLSAVLVIALGRRSAPKFVPSRSPRSPVTEARA